MLRVRAAWYSREGLDTVRRSWLDARNQLHQAGAMATTPANGLDDSDSSSSDSSSSDSDSDSSSSSESSEEESENSPTSGSLDESNSIHEEVSAGDDPKVSDVATEYDRRIAQARAIFRQLDSNTDGVVAAKELGVLASLLGTPLKPDQLESAVAEVDSDADGFIDYDDFERWWLLQLSLRDKLDETADARAPNSDAVSSLPSSEPPRANTSPRQIAEEKVAQVRVC